LSDAFLSRKKDLMLGALGWGALAAASLLLGTVLALVRKTWSNGLVGGVLAFGAGALISSVAFELAEEGLAVGGPVAVALGVVVGALAYFFADRAVESIGGRVGGEAEGLPLALGALLDGIPEQAVLGIGLATGQGVSVALLVAVFVSNLPEAIGSATDMRGAGKSTRLILGLWGAVTVVCVLATLGGYALADVVGGGLKAAINGFAAGALLVMLVDQMVPEAKKKAGNRAGLATVLGFAVAAGLSNLS
jgi:ZIP family zinc transporter